MNNNKLLRQAIIDNLLRFLATGGTISVALIAPGMAQVFDKDLTQYLKKLDERARKREVAKAAQYMKQTGLINYPNYDYEHGISITKKGLERAKKSSLDNLKIIRPKTWDKKWRLVLFDVPEKYKASRDALIRKLKDLGFVQLQRSAWLHPYPCQREIEIVTINYGINKFVSYLEVGHINNQKILKKKFRL